MNFKAFLKEHIFLLDGGMGTLLQAEGLRPGELPERWSVTRPEVITAIHRRYFEAGSHVVNTNTFGANRLKFDAAELEQIVSASVENARRAARESTGTHPKFVALDIGPTGRMLKPYGDLDFEDAVAIFAETVRLGVRCGVDLIFIETMNDSYETKAAVLAAKENSTLPVLVSNAYGADGKLMTGAAPEAMVAMLEGLGADAVGVNCSLGPKALLPVIRQYLQVASVPVFFKPNAGLPHVSDGKTVYDVSVETFAEEVATALGEGVRGAGGCCGTTPAYIEALARRAAHLSPLPVSDRGRTVISSYTHAVVFDKEPILIGERINPTGKKRFKEALRAGDMDYILQEGIAEEERGVHVLDVNVGLPEIDEPAMLTAAVTELQAVLDLPLQLDTSDPVAMERALRRYNGKAMLNSVSGKRESMEAVFPLAKKYGGVVVALTLDESGIPTKAEDRLEIARRILHEAERYGIARKDLIFDPLALTVSADSEAAKETLRAVAMIRRELGCHTSLGVSNVSFGLPSRDAVNSTYFAMALFAGLSAAIMNPHSMEMMKTYHAYRALAGLDKNCLGYISFAESIPAPETPNSVITPKTGAENATLLGEAVVKGLRDRAAALTAELIKTEPPLSLVERELIPALNEVGVGFEEKRVFLPQLLMSAEAAKAAFEVIKGAAHGSAQSNGKTVILATVRGDIHDIGKNIVKLLLENYGFSVVDLGKDVPPQTVAEEAVRLHAPLVGLSALMTTTVPAMAETIALLRTEAPWCRVMVGGAVLTQEYADSIGADHYARDAMEAVRAAEALLR